MKSRLREFVQMIRNRALLGRALVLAVLYSFLFALALWVAYWLRFDFAVMPVYQEQYLAALPWVLVTKLSFLYVFGQFGSLLSHFRLPDLYRITGALSFSSILLVIAWYLLPQWDLPPRSILLADYILGLLLVGGFRTALRVYWERTQPDPHGSARQKRVAIIGAGRTGADLAYDLLSRSSIGIRPMVFLDDDAGKWYHRLHGLEVAGSPDQLEEYVGRYGIKGIIIAMSSASAKRMLELTELARGLGLTTDIMPSMTELATGKVRASRIRPVEIEDLLGREPVDLDSDDIRRLIQEKTILVTGAGGSIGSELCRQIARHNPRRLVLLDQSEGQVYAIEMELRRHAYVGAKLVPLVANICDKERMEDIFRRYRPQIVFHAAAHKHVPIMEHQAEEAIKNNVFGTVALADLCGQHAVERFILISSDKAINPTNVMGVTKRLAEIFIQSLNESKATRTRYMAVRFGNVLGSSGSVVPLFRKQIAEGGPVTVTHPDVIRYFMTIPEATGLVLQCAAQGSGGEIFVLDMGEPIRIVDLARRMIKLSGFEPDRDIEIEFVGLRPGEKLFEELQAVGESYSSTHHPQILRFTGTPYSMEEVRAFMTRMSEQLRGADGDQLKRDIQAFVPEYTPYFE
jgi:FlaA1/EpsC-like NDP-sugar epimerase